ncbi:DUF6603 domain-containing protein, partial [Streptomyces formicae]
MVADVPTQDTLFLTEGHAGGDQYSTSGPTNDGLFVHFEGDDLCIGIEGQTLIGPVRCDLQGLGWRVSLRGDGFATTEEVDGAALSFSSQVVDVSGLLANLTPGQAEPSLSGNLYARIFLDGGVAPAAALPVYGWWGPDARGHRLLVLYGEELKPGQAVLSRGAFTVSGLSVAGGVHADLRRPSLEDRGNFPLVER